MPKMNVRKGDKVEVITGKDKGKQGEVLRAMPKPAGRHHREARPHPRLQRHARLPRLRQAYARWPRRR